ncbi:MAG: phosphoglucosamine mutase [Bacteroidales bacterium]|nr:phosphoglucosamine mutase [Bacteroidales bacterium]
MTLIKSISGIRGTIGGKVGEGLSPLDIVKFSAAFGTWVKQNDTKDRYKIIVGKDARISGEMVNHIVLGTLSGLGIDVINIGMATTPTVEIAVVEKKADGGIILTASHNPKQWNALKLLNNKGEFISAADGKIILSIAESEMFDFAGVDDLGTITKIYSYEDNHINGILELALVDIDAISEANFKIAIDCVNSVGGLVIPKLLNKLGVNNVIELFCEPNGQFPHNPEPLPENLAEISKIVKEQNADLGFVVDPDVDRLAIINEDGTMFGEEYTLVSVADYILKNKSGNTVSNLSSTSALRDITEKYGGKYFASAVGEVNVVEKMKSENAIIGGEGNGGIIYPELHYGRDALVGIALFLTHLAKSGKKCSELRKTYPDYTISKNKIELSPEINVDKVLCLIKEKYINYNINDVDGLKIEFDNEWVHLRKSNTEPIIRIYSESKTKEKADKLAQEIIRQIKKII